MSNIMRLGKLAIGVASAITFFSSHEASANWGGCYDLEIIAQQTKNVSSNDNNGHRIFILMNGNTKIMLQEGAFGVIDYNGTDGSASFSLPSPVNSAGTQVYNVYSRMVGKPNSSIDMTLCATDPTTGALYCSSNALNMSRIAGSSKFQNVSKDLLYMTIDYNGTVETIPLFSSLLDNYYWNVDSTGRAHAQLRFCSQ
jgi:hypothetical protein